MKKSLLHFLLLPLLLTACLELTPNVSTDLSEIEARATFESEVRRMCDHKKSRIPAILRKIKEAEALPNHRLLDIQRRRDGSSGIPVRDNHRRLPSPYPGEPLPIARCPKPTSASSHSTHARRPPICHRRKKIKGFRPSAGPSPAQSHSLSAQANRAHPTSASNACSRVPQPTSRTIAAISSPSRATCGLRSVKTPPSAVHSSSDSVNCSSQ